MHEIKKISCRDGETFTIGGMEFIKFPGKDGQTPVMMKEIAFNSRFGDDNDLRTSTVLKRMQEEILPRIIETIGEENLCTIQTDLTTLDGLKPYGVMESKISLVHDFMQMTLHDKSVMGSRVMGRATLEKIAVNCSKLDDHFSKAFSDDVEADYLQEEMDGVLREIFEDDLIPFAQRYPFTKQYGYLKSRKGWK